MNISSRFLPLIIAVIAMTACATRQVEPLVAHDAKYDLSVQDDPSGKQFLLTLVSSDTRNICVDGDNWPPSRGKLRGREGLAVLHLDSQEIASKEYTFGECSGSGCTFVIQPSGQLVGKVEYAEFGDPAVIAGAKSRSLTFNAAVWSGRGCHK